MFCIRWSLSIALAGIPLAGTAQEATSGGHDLQADTSAISMAMDAKNNALLVVLQKLTTCNAVGKFYRPGATGADAATGCVGGPSDFCGQQGKIYVLGQPGADANGCKKAPDDVPTGTIAAFVIPCPVGWTEYTPAAGRFLVGRGSNGVSSYSTLASHVDDANASGRDYVTLSGSNLPKHRHRIQAYDTSFVYKADDDKHNSIRILSASAGLGPAVGASEYSDYANPDGASAFDNRPYFRVVNWCRK